MVEEVEGLETCVCVCVCVCSRRIRHQTATQRLFPTDRHTSVVHHFIHGSALLLVLWTTAVKHQPR